MSYPTLPICSHILDLVLSPSDPAFVSNVTVSDSIFDHALINCHIIIKVYSRYNKINMHRFHDNHLDNTSFMKCTSSTAADLYYEYIHDLGCLFKKACTIDLWKK